MNKRLYLPLAFLFCITTADAAVTPVPTAPDGLTIDPAGPYGVAIRWNDKAATENSYEIERDTGGATWVSVASVPANTEVYLHSGLALSTSYTYRVRAVNSAGNSAWTASASGSTTGKMNIIFLLADDLGYKDIVALRDEAVDGPTIYETPALDQIVTEGVTFKNAYCSGPRCTNARVALMTGKYHFRPGLQTSGIDTTELTYGEALQAEGYRTAHLGKWHLGGDPLHNDRMPVNQGFDVSIASGEFGAPPDSYFATVANPDYGLPDIAPGPVGEYLTTRLTTEATAFISDHVTNFPTTPFFMTLSHYAVHTPLEAPAADVAYFDGIKNNTDFSTHPMWPTKFILDHTSRTQQWQDNSTYAAMVKSYDDSLAAIRAELVTQGIQNNTVIVISSDHGGKSDSRTTDNADEPTSNFPYRKGKTHVYEGGLKIPVIVYWPGVSEGGGISNALIHGADFFKTFLDMAGATGDYSANHLDSVSFADSVANPSIENRVDALHWYTNDSLGTGTIPYGAYRQGEFKLIRHMIEDVDYLYNIAEDPGETTDLKATHPDIYSEMKAEYERQRNALEVKPSLGSNSANALTLLQDIAWPLSPALPDGTPTLDTVTALSQSTIQLNWTDTSSNEDSFVIKRTTGTGTPVELTRVSAGTTTFTDTGLQPSTLYKYRVSAINEQGELESGTVNDTTLAAGNTTTLSVTNDSSTTEECEAREIEVLLNDVGDGITIVSITQPTNGSAAISGTNVIYTPNPGFTGADSFTYTVNDQDTNPGVGTVNMTVSADTSATDLNTIELTAANVGAGASGSSKTLNDNKGYVISGVGSGLGGTADSFYYEQRAGAPEYDITLRIDAINGGTIPAGGIMIRDNTSANGLFASLSYDPASGFAFNSRNTVAAAVIPGDTLATGTSFDEIWIKLYKQNDSITAYVSNDGMNFLTLDTTTLSGLGNGVAGAFVSNGGGSAANMKFSNYSYNAVGAPAFNTDPITGGEATDGQAYGGTIVAYASDGDGDTFTFSKTAGPAWLNVAANGVLTGTPATGDIGWNTFTVQVSDGIDGSDTATLKIKVIAPGGTTTQFSVMEDTHGKAATPTVAEGLGNNIQIRTGASERQGYLKFNVSGLSGTITSATLNMYNEAVVPLQNVLAYQVADNTWTEVAMTWNTQPALGSLIGSVGMDAVGWYSIDAASYITGNAVYSIGLQEDSNSVIKLESKEGSASEAAYIEVTTSAGNLAPAFNSDPINETNATAGSAYITSVYDNVTDPNNDPLTFSNLVGPAWLSVNNDGDLTGTPTAGDIGPNAWTVQVSDGILTDNATVNITVVSADLYDTWKNVIFTTPAGPNTGRTDDFDGDGYSNEFEYYFGMDPEDASNQNGNMKTAFATVEDAGSAYAAITYTYRNDNPALSYTIETSTNLSTWVDETGLFIQVGSITNNGNGTSTKTLRYNQNFTAVPKLFLRAIAAE